MIQYFVVIFIATTIGAMTGIGGGVIIKPSLDYLNDYPLVTINLLSSISVLTMACVSSYRNRQNIVNSDLSILLHLALGSFVGGIIGKYLFNLLLNYLGIEEGLIANIQSMLLIAVILFVMYLNANVNKIKYSKKINPLLIGTLLGIISSFLAIGGGPLNTIILIIIWNYSNREAAIGSIVIIMFSQISVVLQTLIFNDIANYNLEMLKVMIPAAILGGVVGSKLMQLCTNKLLSKLNQLVLILIVLINMMNIVT